MEQFRIALYVALGFILLLIYQAWEQQRQGGAESSPPVSERPAAELAAQDATGIAEAPAPERPAAPLPVDEPPPPGQELVVETDVLRVVVSTRGGVLRTVALPRYPVSAKRPDEPFALLDDGPRRHYVIRSGLVDHEDAAPDHRALYRTDRLDYGLGPGSDSVRVDLAWDDGRGLAVTKSLLFERGSYVIGQRIEIRNNSDAPWSGSQYNQIVRRPSRDSGRNFLQPVSFQGAAYYEPDEGFKKLDYADMRKEPLNRSVRNGWAGMLEHYFVAAILPALDQPRRYFTQVLPGERYAVGVQSDEVRLAPTESAMFETEFFVGPKLQSALKTARDGLILSVDYGILTALAQPLFWLLDWINGLTGNWGFSIIIVTLLIKLAFYQLSASSYRSMARMRKLQPRLVALRERYGDDRQAMSQKMMELYKEEKFNPLGGCLPILVQIPVFIALYWVLLESVELRQAPFIGWIKDLSSKDPYFILPALMCLSMVAQQRLNPAPLDPIQQKVMTFLPLVFGVLFALFPAGLVLYWFCNNLISIGQQWLITRNVERAQTA